MRIFGSLFSFSGRASRGEFWAIHAITMTLQLAAVVYCLVQSSVLGKGAPSGTISLQALSFRNFFDSISINRTTLLAILLAPLIIQLASAWRRLHDRDKSGGWAIAMLLPVFLSLFLSDIKPDMPRPSDVDLLAIVASTWYFIELGILEGSPGANSYAPRRQVADVIEHHSIERHVADEHPPLPGGSTQGAEAAMDRAIAERRRQDSIGATSGDGQGKPNFVDRRVGRPDTRDDKVERRTGRDRRQNQAAGQAPGQPQGFGRRTG